MEEIHAYTQAHTNTTHTYKQNTHRYTQTYNTHICINKTYMHTQIHTQIHTHKHIHCKRTMRYIICTEMQKRIFQNITKIPDYKVASLFFGVAKKILQNVSAETEGRNSRSPGCLEQAL